MPCVSARARAGDGSLLRSEYAGHDVDAVLTTRESCEDDPLRPYPPDTLVEIPGDSPMHAGTGAGVISRS
ncbi:MAG: hypothetical protein ACLU48_05765 [Clostridiaceae bacterium]